VAEEKKAVAFVWRRLPSNAQLNQQHQLSVPVAAHERKRLVASTVGERRIDPADDQAYTWHEIWAFYAPMYTERAIEAYWEECKVAEVENNDRHCPIRQHIAGKNTDHRGPVSQHITGENSDHHGPVGQHTAVAAWAVALDCQANESLRKPCVASRRAAAPGRKPAEFCALQPSAHDAGGMPVRRGNRSPR